MESRAVPPFDLGLLDAPPRRASTPERVPAAWWLQVWEGVRAAFAVPRPAHAFAMAACAILMVASLNVIGTHWGAGGPSVAAVSGKWTSYPLAQSYVAGLSPAEARERHELTDGGTVATDPGTVARLDLADGSRIYLGPSTELRAERDGGLRLVRGELHIEARPAHGPLRIATEAGVLVAEPSVAQLAIVKDGVRMALLMGDASYEASDLARMLRPGDALLHPAGSGRLNFERRQPAVPGWLPRR